MPAAGTKDYAEQNVAQVVVLDAPPTNPPSRRNPDLPAITINPKRLGGTPTIAGTRLPVAALLDYLSEGYTIRQFVKEYSEVTEGDCEAALMFIKEAVEELGVGVEVED